jgi:hypothetical protein
MKDLTEPGRKLPKSRVLMPVSESETTLDHYTLFSIVSPRKAPNRYVVRKQGGFSEKHFDPNIDCKNEASDPLSFHQRLNGER